jgi:hypothetical protein
MVESFIVCVGDEAKEFVVIQSIATRSSKFFQAAMTRDWKEALEKRVMLPGTKVSVFEAYLQWLYTGHITTTEEGEDYTEMTTFYILSDFLDDVEFRNATLEYIMVKFVRIFRLPGAECVQLAWDETPPKSLLRQLILEMWTLVSFDTSITRLFGPNQQPNQERLNHPNEFVKEHFESLMSHNELARKKSGPSKQKKQLMADFKLRMSGDTLDENAT